MSSSPPDCSHTGVAVVEQAEQAEQVEQAVAAV